MIVLVEDDEVLMILALRKGAITRRIIVPRMAWAASADGVLADGQRSWAIDRMLRMPAAGGGSAAMARS